MAVGKTPETNLGLRVAAIVVMAIAGAMLVYMSYGEAPKHPRFAGSGLPTPNVLAEIGTPGPNLSPEELKRLMLQIVDQEGKEDFVERAVIEGKPFKYFLQHVSRLTAVKIRESVDDRLTYEQLLDDSDLHRGDSYTAGRGVVVEIDSVPLPPEYGFPLGWSVLPGVFINTAKEVFGIRIICGPGSTLYDKLKKGVEEDSLPVIHLSGLFFKNYARRTNSVKEPPWFGPLLVCPEPEFPANVQPRHVLTELREAGYGHLLPSQRINAPKTEERMIFEVEQAEGKVGGSSEIMKPALIFEGQRGSLEKAEMLESAVQDFLKRQPRDALAPAAVVMVRGMQTDAPLLNGLRDKFRKLGVSRVTIKQAFATPEKKDAAK